MAKFNATGIEGLALSMEPVRRHPPDDVVEEMLDAGAAVVVRYHRAEISAQGLVKSGKLLGSMKAHSKSGSAKNDWKRYVLIYPTGSHHTFQSRVVTKQYARSKHGRTYTKGGGAKVVTNSEVGFIQAYGAPRKGIPGHGLDEQGQCQGGAGSGKSGAGGLRSLDEIFRFVRSEAIWESMAPSILSGRPLQSRRRTRWILRTLSTEHR